MSGTYEPGTPADIYYAGTKVRGLRVPGGWSLETDWASFLRDEDVTDDVRPLVVLDPDDREQMDALCKALVNAAYTEREFSLAHSGIHPDTVTTALRSLSKPPKPAEPEKYGAVIAGDGREWFRWTTSERDGFDWCRPGTAGGTKYARWDDLVVARVTNEGVKASD